MPKVTIKGFRCTRCQHEWVPKTDRKPTICPKCKSPYWDRDPAAANLEKAKNARLIAAAPEMYERLRLTAPLLEDWVELLKKEGNKFIE